MKILTVGGLLFRTDGQTDMTKLAVTYRKFMNAPENSLPYRAMRYKLSLYSDSLRDGSPGIESRWGEIFRTSPDRPWGPPSFLYNGYRVFPGGKAAGAWR